MLLRAEACHTSGPNRRSASMFGLISSRRVVTGWRRTGIRAFSGLLFALELLRQLQEAR